MPSQYAHRPHACVSGPTDIGHFFYNFNVNAWKDLSDIGLTSTQRTLNIGWVANDYRVVVCADPNGSETELGPGTHVLDVNMKYVTARVNLPGRAGRWLRKT